MRLLAHRALATLLAVSALLGAGCSTEESPDSAAESKDTGPDFRSVPVTPPPQQPQPDLVVLPETVAVLDAGPAGKPETGSTDSVSSIEQDVKPQGDDAAVDDPGVEDTAPVDTGAEDPCTVLETSAGCPCEEDSDCPSLSCVEGSDSLVCTIPCAETCPEGWSCATVEHEGTDEAELCLPPHRRICRPCSTHGDCRPPVSAGDSYCVDQGVEGRFCATSCDPDEEDCPPDHACEEVLPEGATEPVWQCVPSEGTCTCDAQSRAQGLETSCFARVERGYCPGTRRCTPEGLSECAPDTNAPSCPGACTARGCENEPDCEPEVLQGWCLIEGACYPLLARHPTEPCLGCLPDESSSDWSPLNGASCDDGRPCTAEDRCHGATCVGASYSCDDGLPCTEGSCLGDGTCATDVLPDWCFVSGVCHEPGTQLEGDPCHACRPEVNDTGFSPLSGGACDDGDQCTKADACVVGSCKGEPYACDDGLPCTADTCDGEGGCVHDLSPGWCLIGGACAADGEPKEGDPCLWCRAEVEVHVWTPTDDAPCDDGDACTKDDLCRGSTCVGEPYGCDDGIPCTFDTCLGDGTCAHPVARATCLIEGVCIEGGAQHPEELCRGCRPAFAADRWVDLIGDACDDEDPCTSGDQCGSAGCAGSPYSCDDGLECTADSCDGEGGCTHEVVDGTCKVQGRCYEPGALDPRNPCATCQPDVSKTAFSPVDGGPCQHRDACREEGTCVSGTCVPGPDIDCDDENTCTDDHCDPFVGCFHLNNLLPCDDGDTCTSSDRCWDGQCHGQQMSCGAGETCYLGECRVAEKITQLMAPPQVDLQLPRVLPGSSGGFTVFAFGESDPQGGGTAAHGVWVGSFGGDGAQAIAPVEVAEAAGERLDWNRGVTRRPGGSFLLSWGRTEADGDGTDRDVVLRQVNQGLSPGETRVLTVGEAGFAPVTLDNQGDQSVPSLAPLGDGWLAVFLSNRFVQNRCDQNGAWPVLTGSNRHVFSRFETESAQGTVQLTGTGCLGRHNPDNKMGFAQLTATAKGGAIPMLASQRIDPDGKTSIRLDWWDELGNHGGSLGTAPNATLSTDPMAVEAPDGGALLVWSEVGADGNENGVVALPVTSSWQTLPEARIVVNAHTGGAQVRPWAVLLDEGVVVLWESIGQDGSLGGIYAQRLVQGEDGSWQRHGTEEQVNVATAGDQARPTAAPLGGDSFVVTWEHRLFESKGEVHGRVMRW